MSRSRRLVANLVLLGILVGSAVAIVTGQELWPFSPYPMFSSVRQPVVGKLWIRGVLGDGTEVRLTSHRAFHPLRLAQLTAGLERLSGERLDAALRDVLARYGAERRAGYHDGPRLSGIRIYRMTFLLDADLLGRDRPLSQVLVAEAFGEG